MVRTKPKARKEEGMKGYALGKKLYLGFVVLLTIFLAFSGQIVAAAEKEPIKIGEIGGLTGPQYLTFKPHVDGVNLAVKEINASGGILGRSVEIILRDDETKVDIAVKEMRDLILRKKVDIVIGGASSGTAMAQSEVAKTYRVPFLIDMANSYRITEEKGHRYVFQIPPSTRTEGTALAIFTAKQGWKSIYTLSSDFEFARSLTNIYLAKLKQLVPDLKVLGQYWPKLGETDFTPYITAIMAAKPDFLFSGCVGSDLINLTRQGKAYGLYEKIPASGMYDLSLLKGIGSEMVEGAVAVNRGDFFCVNTPEMKAFVDKFRSNFGGDYPPAYAVFGYEAVYCIKQAMEKAKSTNKEKVIDALEGMEFRGPGGKFSFRPYDHMANRSVYVGFTTKSPDYPFYVYKDILKVTAEETWLPVEEVKKLRGGK
jgi:branched-chain amino acid transport system substrate-binding protein